ncbi:MAG: hypothetical protein U9O59_02060 [Actinomycetota bacterium]|nr:hypothetical protein [Actinomycetota bacterium]
MKNGNIIVAKTNLNKTSRPRNLNLARAYPVNEPVIRMSPTVPTVTMVLFRKALEKDGFSQFHALIKFPHCGSAGNHFITGDIISGVDFNPDINIQ